MSTYATTDTTATATLRSVLAQVHRRTNRYALQVGRPELATVATDEDELTGFLRKATREIAVRTGRVYRRHTVAVADATAESAVPGWIYGARVVRATWTPTDGTAVALPVQHRTDGGQGRDARLAVDPFSGVLTFGGVTGAGSLSLLVSSVAGVVEPANEGGSAEIDALFPDELEEAVVRYVLAMWYEETDPAASGRHAEKFSTEVTTFATDRTQVGFARRPARRF